MIAGKLPDWRGRPVTRFHTMAKPVGARCNLNCSYCYYLSKEQLLNCSPSQQMPDDVLEEFIRQYIEGQNFRQIIFSWQGGEPTLLGLSFFKKVVKFQKKYCPRRKTIENDLQTNGMLIDRRWCKFLRENGFLVGLSIDGPRSLHNRHRLDKVGNGSFSRVVETARLLKKHGVPFNTLTVVNRDNAARPLDVYRFLTREIGSTWLQFIPIVEPRAFRNNAPQTWLLNKLSIEGTPAARPGAKDSVVTDWSVDPDDYGKFLISVFDEWRKRDIGKRFVFLFECALRQWMGEPGTLCSFVPVCGKNVAIEHDGTVFACDHYVYPEYRLGNIKDHSLSKLIFSKRQVTFGLAKAQSLPIRCRKCQFLFACNGGCPKNRFIRTSDGEPGLNYLCSGLSKYFRHIDPYMKEMARKVSPKRRQLVGSP